MTLWEEIQESILRDIRFFEKWALRLDLMDIDGVYEEHAKALEKTVDGLSTKDKQQALLNSILEEKVV